MSTTPVANLPPVSITPVANCRRYQGHRRQILQPVFLVFLTPVANLPPVSTIPAANLPPVSTTPVARRWQIAAGINDAGGKFATGVVDTGVVDTGGK